jgi:hypothetical protein
MRARWTVPATLLAMAALVAMPAMAEETEETATDSADRALIHSYDPDAMQLLWATSGVEGAEDYCNVEDGDSYTYEVDGDEVTVTLDDEELEGEDLAEACDFTATDVTGPQGQVNHGTVVSAFVHALKANGYTGIGCYVKLIAQSDYGKDDQQIQVGEEAPEATEGDADLSFTVDTTQCGKPDHAGPPADKGQPEKAGPPEGKGKPPWAGPEGKDSEDHPGKGKGRP